jgi:hypothetical protein
MTTATDGSLRTGADTWTNETARMECRERQTVSNPSQGEPGGENPEGQTRGKEARKDPTPRGGIFFVRDRSAKLRVSETGCNFALRV